MIKLEEITFVIPTNKEKVITVDSIPEKCKIIVRKDHTQGRARNAGIHLAITPWIVFADDDIGFTRTFLEYVMQLAEEKKIVGLQGYAPSPWLISRFMFFHKSIFMTIGELKEVRHGEETEWCIRATKAGYKLLGLPRESVYHHPHEQTQNKNEFKNLLWLLSLHPDLFYRGMKTVTHKMFNSND